MAEAQKPFLIGAAAGAVMLVIAAPAVGLLWKRAAAERGQMLTVLGEVSSRLDKNNAALEDMRKAASLAGVTKQMEELNTRIKSTNEALAGVQKASLDNIRDRLEQVETGVKSGNAALAGLQKGLSPDGMSKQLETARVRIEALETSLADLKQAMGKSPAMAAPVKVATTIETMKSASLPASVPTELIVVHMQNAAAAQTAAATAASAAIAPLSVHFQKIGGTDETAQTVAIVGKMKELLKNRRGCAISIAGYADTLGDDDINLAVSKDRAHVIAAKLKEALGADVQIAETAWGERRLAEMTKDNVASKANRRVDIAVQCKS